MEKKRFTATERDSMLKLFAGLDGIEVALERLGNRLEGIHYANGAKGMVRKLMTELTAQMPDEQKESLLRNAKHLVWDIRVSGPCKPDKSKDDGVWIPFYLLEEVSKHIKSECLVCSKDPQEQKKCRLRKFYDILPIEGIDEDSGRCPYEGGLY